MKRLFGLVSLLVCMSSGISFCFSGNTTLTTQDKIQLKQKFFIPTIKLYKKIVVDKQISDYISNIAIHLEVGNKVPVGSEIEAIKQYVFSFLPPQSKQLGEKIWNKSDYIRQWLLPGITTREYGRARVNNPKNGYGNYQITAPDVCRDIINPNSIVAGLGRKVYFTPPSLCEGVYRLCYYVNKNISTCTCGNKDYRFQQAKLLNGKAGFNASQWINAYNSFCQGKAPDTNVFASVFYPFQYADFIGFVYNKINGYNNGITIINNLRNGIVYGGRKILSLSELINKSFGVNFTTEINSILDGYKNFILQDNQVLTDLADPSLNFPVVINGQDTTYQQVLVVLANKLGITPDQLTNIFNSYQMAIVFSKYNGLGNVGKQFFDNSYVSNITDKGAQNLGLQVHYIFGKIYKDNCPTCIRKDGQMYGAMIFANIYNKKSSFLSYLLMQMFPNMINKGLFSKLVDYKIF